MSRDRMMSRIGRRVFIERSLVLVALAGIAPIRARGQSSDPAKMKLGVVGSGRLGGAVGSLWVKAGHPVLFSSRHPDQLQSMVADLGPLARAGYPKDAAEFGEAVLIAVPYGAVPQVGRDLAPMLQGKVVLDACNAVASRDGAIVEEVKANGIGITSQKYFPGARLVRAFNTLGSGVLRQEANRAEPRMAIPLAGDDAEALKVASALVRDAGFDPVVVGSLRRADDFAQGARGYGQRVSAPELRRTLGLE